MDLKQALGEWMKELRSFYGSYQATSARLDYLEREMRTLADRMEGGLEKAAAATREVRERYIAFEATWSERLGTLEQRCYEKAELAAAHEVAKHRSQGG